jgi:hypothetical protein
LLAFDNGKNEGGEMRMRKPAKVTSVIVGMMGLIMLAGTPGSGQKLAKSLTIQATAMGESTQIGQMYDVTLVIEEYSTPDDQKALLTAFSEKQNEGLVNALSKMKSKGRMFMTGTLGYDVAYIRQWKEPDGSTKIRLVTNRPIRFGEAWSDSRSMDYNLSGVDIILSPDKKKNSGTLVPRCQLKLNKQNQIELELYQNAWRLANIQER